MHKPLVSWTPDKGGFYPVLCSRCHRVIGSVETIAGKSELIKQMGALHFCSSKNVRTINHAKLIEARKEAVKGNFDQANIILKQAYLN